MRILVTGGLGFIGSHLVAKLLSDGHRVTIADAMVNPCPYLEKTYCRTHPRLTVKRIDVSRTFPRGSFDQIYHLACVANPSLFLGNHLHTFMTIVMGTYHAMQHAQRTGARILVASSSEVYGTLVTDALIESMAGEVLPYMPRACYSEGKRAGETVSYIFRNLVPTTNVRVVRIFNVYGPGMREKDGRVINRFVVSALKGKDLIVHGNGTQTRSFCYVDDTVDGLMAIMDRPVSLPIPVNLGNPNEEHQIRNLAKRVVKSVGSSSNIVKLGGRPGDTTRRRPDIQLMSKVYGWAPQIDLVLGLQHTIGWYREHL